MLIIITKDANPSYIKSTNYCYKRRFILMKELINPSTRSLRPLTRFLCDTRSQKPSDK